MQNIINFDNIISSKKVSVNLINELIGYAEDEKNIPAIRKAVAAVRGGKPFIMPDKNGNRDSGKWYKAFYAKMKDKNDELLRKAFLALRESGMTNHEIAEKTGSYRVSELIGATPKPLLIAHREKLNGAISMGRTHQQTGLPIHPQPIRTHGISTAASCFRKESVTHRYTACSPAQAAPTMIIVATISRVGRTLKPHAPPAML